MTEQIDNLKATVAELEAELQSIETRRRRHSRGAGTSGAGHPRRVAQAAAPGERAPQSVMDRLHAAAQEFEETHPTVTGILSRLIDGLGQMGI